ncbi:nucleotide pyrophosphohydrolase [Enterococcus sp. CWB-B31]|uniref:nucleotide pyrophosphohydrolase n=1 Tax=Enterococcus sp. CWB-B31 TaxID=2885159 RepID=UPI001E2DA5D9|nr:nucleotide pyrophosphohydrolase [Enterococcus sp. CWB-B31]MCB5955696.1 nucleotide pyrophosphohydrolase [Enterococcus sp. CWB-B31]
MEDLINEINHFRDERDWRQFHHPKDLAISISLEASELLENFQWLTDGEALQENTENIRQELADVLIYSLMLASDLNLDVKEIIRSKMKLNAIKYPVEKSKGTKEKYTEL